MDLAQHAVVAPVDLFAHLHMAHLHVFPFQLPTNKIIVFGSLYAFIEVIPLYGAAILEPFFCRMLLSQRGTV